MIVVDYGVGNIGSILNMLKKIGVIAKFSKDPDDILHAKALLLPGVGAFDEGMSCLVNSQLIDVLSRAVNVNNIPLLGICLGMQLLFDTSEEGSMSGLGWIHGNVTRFDKGALPVGTKVPHMGWNTVQQRSADPLLNNLDDDSRFYFVHSYHVNCSKQQNIVATTDHGYPFTSIVRERNIWGVQFHPEKSHRFGMKLLDNFAGICKC